MSIPAAFIIVVFIWSTTPLGIKWSSVGVGYEFGVAARMTIGSAAVPWWPMLIRRLLL